MRISEAASGVTGLEAAARDRPDLVVLDLSMPDLDGIEVLRRLREDAAGGTLPVIVHSGRRLDDEERQAIERHGAVLVPKDAPPGSVADAVRAAFEMRTAGPSPRGTDPG
jgi:sigma-B regulation protein RsbU (phosphoserine phosphatase)